MADCRFSVLASINSFCFSRISLSNFSLVVPSLSVKSMLLSRIYRRYDTHIKRNGNYKTFIGAHALSYADSNVWNDIDVFGIVNGANSLVIDLNNFVSFKG